MLKKTLEKILLPRLASFLIRLVGMTLRVTIEGDEIIKKSISENRPNVYLFWHNRLFYLPLFSQPIKEKLKILISPSGDGEMLAEAMDRFGIGNIRASSYQQARKGLLAMTREIKNGFSIGIVADGSRGPKYKLQPGSLMLSKLTGAAIVPITVAFSSYWSIGTWDRFRIPKPFAKAIVKLGDPFVWPEGDDKTDFEKHLKRLQEEMDRLMQDADQRFEERVDL